MQIPGIILAGGKNRRMGAVVSNDFIGKAQTSVFDANAGIALFDGVMVYGYFCFA